MLLLSLLSAGEFLCFYLFSMSGIMVVVACINAGTVSNVGGRCNLSRMDYLSYTHGGGNRHFISGHKPCS